MAYGTTSTARDTQPQDGRYLSVKVAASQTIKKGDIILSKAADGFAYKAFAAASAATGDTFLGVATENLTSGSTDGDSSLTVDTGGIHEFSIAATATQAVVGDKVWHDNGANGTPQTVIASAGTHGSPVGWVAELVSGTKVRVLLNALKESAA